MKTRFLALCALFTALMVLCAWISVPIGDIAVTMQTFALFMTLFLLGGRGGLWVVCCYLTLGAVGVPVFSGFRGGLGALLGPTGGYLMGFALGAVVYAILTKKGKNQIFGAVLCLLTSYAAGTVWFSLVYADGASWIFALSRCVLPFVIPDLLKLWLARQMSKRLRKFAR